MYPEKVGIMAKDLRKTVFKMMEQDMKKEYKEASKKEQGGKKEKNFKEDFKKDKSMKNSKEKFKKDNRDDFQVKELEKKPKSRCPS